MPARESSIVTIKVSFAVHRRGGRKLVLALDGRPWHPRRPRSQGFARAFRWQRMLEIGRCATIKEIAKAERINPSYVSRVLGLTLLAPTVEAVLDGRADAALTLAEAMAPFRVSWLKQADGLRHCIASPHEGTRDGNEPGNHGSGVRCPFAMPHKGMARACR